MDAARVALEIEDELRGAGDPARAEREKAYLKSDLRHFGASVPAIRKIAEGAFEDHVPGCGELLLLVETTDHPRTNAMWVPAGDQEGELALLSRSR